MKKLLLILLCVPLIGLGQVITTPIVNYGVGGGFDTVSVDITTINVEFISIQVGKLTHILDYGQKKNNGKPKYFKIKRNKSRVLDGEVTIKLISENDIINYFSKYGFSYEGTNSNHKSFTSTNTYTKKTTVHNKTTTTITLRNNNN